MILGFTATREGMTDAQLAWLYSIFEDGLKYPTQVAINAVHHGACVGGDAQVHAAALEAGTAIHVWPPVNPKYLAHQCLTPHPLVTVHPAMPYLDRDRQIVGSTAELVAFPKHGIQPDRALWGGTWYTVDFAERVNKRVTIVYPTGTVEQRLPM